MRAEFHQGKCFTLGWDDRQLIAVPVAIEPCGADGPLIVQNQLLQVRRPSPTTAGNFFSVTENIRPLGSEG
jgi:hypothetical protein